VERALPRALVLLLARMLLLALRSADDVLRSAGNAAWVSLSMSS
jgi:hypothetical protein